MSSSAKDRIWVLAPGAELELRQRLDGYFPPAKVRHAIEQQSFDKLTAGEHFLLSHQAVTPRQYRGKRALFWCPTRSSRRTAEQAGLAIGHLPSTSTLRIIHDKGFLSNTRLRLIPGHRVVEDRETWETLRNSTPFSWRVKRRFGFAGRGQRTMKPNPSADDRKWIDNGFLADGFVAEPHMPHNQVYSIHGLIAQRTFFGTLCTFRTDRHGAPQEVTPVEHSPRSKIALRQAELAAEALLDQGYWGPFGLDFLADEDGRFVIDLNPRFSMGWSLGFGQKRDEAIEAHLKWVFR